ncbi:MAG: septum formation initiator family protein [Flavobacteriales bacterium]|nr:septum formation initiator family protein [Flavobacteriales bacterium]
MKIERNRIFTLMKDYKYLVIFIFFLIWMLFIDTNSWLIHRDLSKKIDKLEDRKEFYKNEISNDRKTLDEINNNPEMLEKYARERFYMKKKDEDIFIIKEE